MTIAENLDRLVTAKNDIAEAIVNKGGTVAETDGLESFAEKINGIPTGGAPEWFGKDSSFARGIDPLTLSRYPYGGIPFVLNNEINIIGKATENGGGGNVWIKFNGTRWVDTYSSSGISFGDSIVVYNNVIYRLGYGYMDIWDGSSWYMISYLPYYAYRISAVVYNNEIHILGGDSTTNHYKWNGSSWIKVSTLPYGLDNGSAVVHNNEIHIFGQDSKNHYKWNGSSWIKVSTPPENYVKAFSCNGSIIIINSYGKKCKWNGSSWSTSPNIMPFASTYSVTTAYKDYLVTVFLRGAYVSWGIQKIDI